MMGRLLLVDDYAAIRKALRFLLTDGEMDVCGEAEDGAEAVRQVEKLHPDLVILDVDMPGVNGFEAAQQIRVVAPETKILFFSSCEPITDMFNSIGDGFVPKTQPEKLIATVRRLLHA
jgi:DNA-binding NarL/FixJ family response regulator